MLYRLRPTADVTWCKPPVRDVLDLAKKTGANLDNLDWQPSTDTAFSRDLLRLALRHGVPTKTAIVLDSQYVEILSRPDQLRTTSFASDQTRYEVRQSSGEIMEEVLPGWTAQGENADGEVRESVAQFVQAADKKLAEELAPPVKPELQTHWEDLGGTLPD